MLKVHRLEEWRQYLDCVAGDNLPNVLRSTLYRGQADAAWQLTSTLERRGRHNMAVHDYYRMVAGRVRPHVESYTGRRFELPDPISLRSRLLMQYEPFSSDGFPPEVRSYLIFARHHGFPSPLVDWTRSPYVAAFFAFAPDEPKAGDRAILAWQRPPLRRTRPGKAQIHHIDQFVPTHRRHVLQQAEYSFRATYNELAKEWRFEDHGAAFESDELNSEQLVIYRIPSTQRPLVLGYLDAFNLNAYSLFGTEESLMETIAVREFLLGISFGNVLRGDDI